VNRVQGRLQVDTSIVQVVRRQTQLVAIEVSPTTVTLAPGISQTFTALGRLSGGSVVPIGVTWSATGGSIDGGGTYVAGDTAGTYQVRATNTAGTIADTVTVTITAPSTPPPPSAPDLAEVILKPWSTILAPSASRQFAVYGRTITGDSVPVSVTFTATGGTITSGGLYTAGTTAGKFRVIATTGTHADTSGVEITAPLGSGTGVGVPFGPFDAWDGSTLRPNTEVFTSSLSSVNPLTLPGRIDAARAKRVKLVLAMTGGSHAQYMSVINGVYQFDMGKWKAKMDLYNTPALRAAVSSAVSEGIIVGNILMDEPANISPDNSWGPAGTMNKARVDTMAAYARAIFPTLPMGVTQDYTIWQEDSYRKLDFIISQYRARKGDVVQYRDNALALGARDRHKILFSLNVLDGGARLPGCPIPETGGPGTYGPNCRMTPEEIRKFGSVLGPAGCALVMWRYESDYMANPYNQEAFKYLADRLGALPAKSCKA
jgi:hypothetical protein